jgi:hypothetical protein
MALPQSMPRIPVISIFVSKPGKESERNVFMAEMRFDPEAIDFPHCPTCHASLVNPINHMITPTHCDFCWHLSIRDALLRFLAYLGLAWLVSQQGILSFPYF